MLYKWFKVYWRRDREMPVPSLDEIWGRSGALRPFRRPGAGRSYYESNWIRVRARTEKHARGIVEAALQPVDGVGVRVGRVVALKPVPRRTRHHSTQRSSKVQMLEFTRPDGTRYWSNGVWS